MTKAELVETMAKDDTKLPLSFKPFIHGESEDQITANILKLKTVFEKEIQNTLEIKLKDLNKNPEESGDKKKPEKSEFDKFPEK